MSNHHYIINNQSYDSEDIHDIFGEAHSDLVNAGVLKTELQGKTKINFTGFIFTRNKNVCCFPKIINIGLFDTQLKKDKFAKLLFSSLARYFRSDLYLSTLGQNPEEVVPTSNLLTGYELLIDYRNKGLLQSNKKVLSKNSINPICWKKTICDNVPFTFENNLVYLESITKLNRVDNESFISQIHLQIIQNCWKEIGWLIGMEKPTPFQRQFNIQKARTILGNCLFKLFRDREKRIVKLMIKYLECDQLYNSNHGVFKLYGTKNFEYVWEDICSSLVQSEYGILSKYIPRPEWFDSCEGIIRTRPRNSKPIPDILFTSNDFLHIVDAKDYDIQTSRPGLHDLWKQFYYAISIKEAVKYHKLKITNSIFFPWHNSINERRVIQRFSEIFSTYQNQPLNNLSKINAYLIDIVSAMISYVNKKSLKNEICAVIESDQSNNCESGF